MVKKWSSERSKNKIVGGQIENVKVDGLDSRIVSKYSPLLKLAKFFS